MRESVPDETGTQEMTSLSSAASLRAAKARKPQENQVNMRPAAANDDRWYAGVARAFKQCLAHAFAASFRPISGAKTRLRTA